MYVTLCIVCHTMYVTEWIPSRVSNVLCVTLCMSHHTFHDIHSVTYILWHTECDIQSVTECDTQNITNTRGNPICDIHSVTYNTDCDINSVTYRVWHTGIGAHTSGLTLHPWTIQAGSTVFTSVWVSQVCSVICQLLSVTFYEIAALLGPLLAISFSLISNVAKMCK